MSRERVKDWLEAVVVAVVFVVWLLLFASGLYLILGGHDEQHRFDQSYTVFFKRPGEKCDYERAVFDVVSGQPLFCRIGASPYYGGSQGNVELPGFTPEQNRKVTKLVADLWGAHNVQQQVQVEIDSIVASLPPEKRLYHDSIVWGNTRALIGYTVLIVTSTTAIYYTKRHLL